MKIKKILIIVLCMMCITFLPGCFETELYKLDIKGSSVGILDYSGTESALVTPTEIEGYEISELGYSVYSLNIYIREVKITSNIHYIRACAFWYCSYLEKVYIPSSVTSIEPYAFHGCKNLKEVYYEGSAEDFLKMFEDSLDNLNSNSELVNANIHYNYSEEQ